MKIFKLSKTSLVILIIGVIVVAFGILGVTRANQVKQQQRLDEELAMAEMLLSKIQLDGLRSQKDELEGRLEQAAPELETVSDDLNQPIDSITVVDSLFAVAGASGVEIVDLRSSQLGSGKLEGIDCSTIQLNMQVQGSVPDLIGFVIRLNNDFVTGVVELVQMDTQMYEDTEGELEEEPAEEDEEIPSVNIRMIVYSHQGG